MVSTHPFQHCTACGGPGLSWDGSNRFSCPHCGFVFFHNTAAACGAILVYHDADDQQDRILLLVRGKEPELGKLDFPGGFIDPGESAEDALAREIREEIGISVESLEYFWSAPNRYQYRGVTYNTCDLVYLARTHQKPLHLQESEISGYRLVKPHDIDLHQIAFPSLREALRHYIQGVSAESSQDL